MSFGKLYVLLIAGLCCCYACNRQSREKEVRTIDLPRPTGSVNDFYDLYTPSEEAIVVHLIDSFERKTTIEIGLVTLTEDMTGSDSLSLSNFTLALANEWKVWKKENTNGILVGISPVYRKMHIQNSHRIENIITNRETGAIIREGFFPGFVDGNYFSGTVDGLRMLMEKLTKNIEKKNGKIESVFNKQLMCKL